MKKTFSFVFFLFITLGSLHAQFAHPGIHHKKSDLERAKYAIKAGVEPWASSFANLKADSPSSYDYVVQGNPSITEISREPAINKGVYESDMIAAYQNALMYWYTDDQRHADKAIEILNTWSNLTSVGGTPLNVGLYVAPMVNAAELIKHSNAGWNQADMQKFSDMLVHPGYSNTTIPQADINAGNHTFYWGIYNGDPSRAGNQELAAFKGMISIGIFLDNELIYDRAVRYVSGQTHRSEDLPYESGPKTPTTLDSENNYRIHYNWTQSFDEADYGYDGVITNYIYENGQSQESARDQVHALYGVSLCAQIAEIAWNQGDDLYSLTDDLNKNRILLGLEYGARYNLSYLQDYPDQSEAWEPVGPDDFYQRFSRTARTFNKQICPFYENDETRLSRGVNIDRPYWEQPLQHYKYRMNLDESEYIWTQRSRDYNITNSGKYEVRSSSSTDSPGWGALNFGRVEGCPGDPISGFNSNGVPIYEMNVLPMTIEAENFDYFVTDGQDKTYYDVSTNTQGAVYRSDESVDLKIATEGGYAITNIEDQEWLNYTINVPADGTYDIAIKYASSNANGNIKFNIGGLDITTDVNVPFGAPNSTGLTDWKDFTVANNVTLTKGPQALKVMFSGASDSFELNSITFDINTLALGEFEFLFETDGDSEGWSLFNGGGINVASGALTYTYNSSTSGFQLNPPALDIYLDKANYPYLAIKLSATPSLRRYMYLKTNGTGAWWKNKSNPDPDVNLDPYNVFYYDMSGDFFTTTALDDGLVERLIFNFEDGSGATSVDVEWIKTFASIEDIEEYVGFLSTNDFQENVINIFPNPVEDSFIITKSLGSDIEIYNIMGKLLTKHKIEKNAQEINISDFVSGVYFVRINDNEGTITTKKIVKD